MAFITTLLFALAIVPSMLGYAGQNCPTEEWKKYTFPDGTFKCYITSFNFVQEAIDLIRIATWCSGIHYDARPALLESPKVVDFIQKNVIPDDEWHNVGYLSDKDNIVRDYTLSQASVEDVLPELRASKFPNSVLKIGKNGTQFSKVEANESTSTVCSINVLPELGPPKTPSYTPPPFYTASDCPNGFWERKDVGYATKCFRVYIPRLFHRCRISKGCSGAHPSALPASIRNENEIQYLKDVGVTLDDPMLYTGMHIPCDRSSTQAEYVQVNGEPMSIPANAIDNPDYAHNPILGNFGYNGIKGLSERRYPRVLCEIYLSEAPINGCREGFHLIKDKKLCFSDHLLPYA